MNIKHSTVSGLVARVGDGSSYNIRNLKISLSLGAKAECSFNIISEITGGEGKNELKHTTTTEQIHSAFKYGQYISVEEERSGGLKVFLFSGYVLNVGNSFISGPYAIESTVTITLVNGAEMYSNESVRQPHYITRDRKFIAESTFASTSATKVTAQYLQNNSSKMDIVKYTSELIDWVTDQRKVSWPRATGTSSVHRISDVVNTATAPKLNWGLNHTSHLAKMLEHSIMSSIQQRTGLEVFRGVLDNFFMILAPRINGLLDVIPNAGIAKHDGSSILTPSDILGYQLYPSQYRANKYTTAATVLPGSNTLIYALILGHDSAEQPVAIEYKYEDLKKLAETAAKSGLILPYGAISYIPLPDWAILLDRNKGKSETQNNQPIPSATDKILNEYYPLARIVCKGSIATGGGFSGRLVLGVLPEKYSEVCNSVGTVFKIDYSNPTTGDTAVRYGRLVDIHYSIDVSKDSLSTQLTLSFDCVLTESEYSKFSINPKDVGFTNI